MISYHTILNSGLGISLSWLVLILLYYACDQYVKFINDLSVSQRGSIIGTLMVLGMIIFVIGLVGIFTSER